MPIAIVQRAGVRRVLRRLPFACLLCAGLLSSSNGRGDDWSQFRGPNASGVSTESDPLPSEFSFQQHVRWSLPLADGVASPIVSHGRAFVTAMSGEQTFAVMGLDVKDGTVLWKTEFPTGTLPAITPPNSHASSTPASDGKRVYVYFSTLGLIALDATDGSEVWRHPLDTPAYLMDWGAAASPIVLGDQLIFNQDDDLTPYLLSLDSATGKQRWRTERTDMLAGYAVPVVCQVGDRTDLVVAGTGKLKGYDPETGEERWSCNTLLRTIMTSPVVHDGVIYVAVQSYGDTERILKYALLEWKDTNQDKKLAKEEVPRQFWRKFAKADADGNQFLEGDELDHAFQSPENMAGGGSIVQAIRGGGEGDVTATHLLWNLQNKAPSNMSSPLVVGDRVFLVKRGGISNCFEAGSGKPVWETKRIQNLGEYYASPISADGKIFIAGENGFVVVLKEGPELKVVAKNDMGDVCVATPAISGGALFIRTQKKLFCISQDAP